MAIAADEIEALYDPATDRLTIGFVTGLVALATGVPAREISARTRARAAAAQARQMAMYLAHVGLAWPMARVGMAFGRDRTTASHACHKMEDMREDAAFDAHLTQLEACIRASPALIRGLESRL